MEGLHTGGGLNFQIPPFIDAASRRLDFTASSPVPLQ